MVAKRKASSKTKRKRVTTTKTKRKRVATRVKAAQSEEELAPLDRVEAQPVEEPIEEFEDQMDHQQDYDDDGPAVEARRCQHYLTQVYFDKSREQYIATVLEFPNLQSSGVTAEDAVEDLWSRIEAQIEDREDAGKPIPEPVLNRRYPESLVLPISQSLYRRLDMMSRQDRIPLEQLATELLSRGAFRERRESRPDRNRNEFRKSNNNNNNNKKRRKPRRERNSEPNGNRAEPDGNRIDYKPRSSEGSFLEYVRRLEQGGPKGKRRF